jgi:hypothetical protein
MSWLKGFALIVSLLLGSGAAIAADAAVPGEFLSSLDRSLEDFRASLTKDPEAKAASQLKYAAERLSEAQGLSSQEHGGDLDTSLTASSTEDLDRVAISRSPDGAMTSQDSSQEGALDIDDDDEIDLDDDDDDGDDQDDYCLSEESHPRALDLSDTYSVTVGTIMDWFCGDDAGRRFGMGQIKLALETTAGITPTERITNTGILLDLRAEGYGWGQIWKMTDPYGESVDEGATENALRLKHTGRPDHAGPPSHSESQGNGGNQGHGGNQGNGGNQGHGGRPDSAGKKDKHR